MRVPVYGPLFELVERSTRSAVSNAREAAAAVSAAAADRLALTQAVTEQDEGGAPGQLSRLSRSTCLELLGTRSVGRLAYIARAGTPDIVPVNYCLQGSDVLIRSGPGPKLQAAERGDRVAFEVDELDETGRRGWSVVVAGTVRRLSSSDLRTRPEADLPTPWASGPRSAVIRLVPARLEGRRLG